MFSDKKNIEGYALKEKKKALLYAEKAQRYLSFYLAVVGSDEDKHTEEYDDHVIEISDFLHQIGSELKLHEFESCFEALKTPVEGETEEAKNMKVQYALTQGDNCVAFAELADDFLLVAHSNALMGTLQFEIMATCADQVAENERLDKAKMYFGTFKKNIAEFEKEDMCQEKWCIKAKETEVALQQAITNFERKNMSPEE